MQFRYFGTNSLALSNSSIYLFRDAIIMTGYLKKTKG